MVVILKMHCDFLTIAVLQRGMEAYIEYNMKINHLLFYFEWAGGLALRNSG